jgi:MFS family permease
LNQGLGWRSNFYFLAIFGFLTWLGIVFGLPETWRASPLMTEKAPAKDTSSQKEAQVEFSEDIETQSVQKKKRKFVNPIAALRLLLFPNIALAVTFVGVL